MQQQSASLSLLIGALVGTLVTVQNNGDEAVQLPAGTDNLQHLKPGDTITIKVLDDTEWLQRVKAADERAQAEAQQQDADAQRAAFNASQTGQTLEQGLAQANAEQPDAGTSAAVGGDVVADDGAQVTRTTGGTAAAGGTTSPTRATRSTKA